MNRLDHETFARVVENTPLVSIDLILKDGRGNVLLGRRKNEPAKDFWFVPGGRIYKNETIADAFSRIVYEETGRRTTIAEGRFLGIYEHFYENSFCDKNISTHYIVLAYAIDHEFDIAVLPAEQHTAYKQIPVEQLLRDADVHPHVKSYFKPFYKE